MEIYDYIVVGAGSSGCVVASRLSENPAVRVLLVEAGSDMNNFWVRTPAGAGKLFMDKRFNWAFNTEPVPTLGGRKVYWPRGKGLGGSSAINGMQMMRSIAQADPLASRIVSELAPGAPVASDEQWLEHLKTNGNSGWHQVGTCRMGRDAQSVVDPQLRVRGARRLRVVDASIMPRIVAGNTNAACIMIGEKGADMIRADALAARSIAH
ncbi:GMC oxidoreductase [Paraburkholderia oxyphila]|uniref:GMC oxidoreductase n=1 Tax=Paraburkholderia oxyphila TaxID=614212 RepID=UPI0004880BFF|nr:GMC oxidoreductase [Paraburkholderia oxyphila]